MVNPLVRRSGKYKFVLLNITSCGRRNVRKHKEINNSEQNIVLGISLKLDCLLKSQVLSSVSR